MSLLRRRAMMSEYIRDDADEELDYFTIIPWSSESDIVQIYIYGYFLELRDGTSYMSDFWYSIDDGEWIKGKDEEIVEVATYHKLRIKGNGSEIIKLYEENIEYVNRLLTNPFECDNGGIGVLLEGTPLSLLHGDNFKEKKNELYTACFEFMFANSNNIIQVNNPKTFLPSTELAPYCYYGMFSNSSICNAPELPAETLQEYCYSGMFYGCHYLKEAPELHAKVNAPYCYESIFGRCTLLSYIKIKYPENFNLEDYYNFSEGLYYGGVAVLDSELMYSEIKDILQSQNFAVIDENYPVNDEGYPETVNYSDNIYCLINADFVIQDTINFYSYYRKEANNVGRNLYEDYMNDYYIDKYIFINRKPFFFYDVEENASGTDLIFRGNDSIGDYYAAIHNDGSVDVDLSDFVIRDYIKK